VSCARVHIKNTCTNKNGPRPLLFPYQKPSCSGPYPYFRGWSGSRKQCLYDRHGKLLYYRLVVHRWQTHVVHCNCWMSIKREIAWVLGDDGNTLKLQLTVGPKFDHDYSYQWMKDLEVYEGSLEGVLKSTSGFFYYYYH
jgi:hypothetical protein